MAKRLPTITQDDLAAAIEEARQDFGQVIARPEGALSVREWASKLGLGHTSMRQKMNAAVAAGTYERIVVREKDTRGHSYDLPVYRKAKKDSVDHRKKVKE